MLLGLSVQVAMINARIKDWIKEVLGTSFRENLIKHFIILSFCSFDYSFGVKHKKIRFSTKILIYCFLQPHQFTYSLKVKG